MIITKVFDIIFNINNINDLFNKDINQTILNLLKKKYNGKCFLGVYIIDVIKIINRSLIESNQSNLNGSFNIFIQFEGKCVIYNTNEIIFNMEVKDNINNIISCKGNNVSAIIKTNKINIDFKKGQLIPIIVGKAKFITGSEIIQINSYPLIPIIDNKQIYYKINEISNSIIEKLNESILNYINEEEEIKSNILKSKNNKWNYFSEFLYPYKINKSNDLIKKENLVDLLELKNIQNSILYLDNTLDLSKRLIYKYNNDNDNIIEYIEDDTYLVLYDILKKYYLYLKSINQLSLIYDTNEKIKSNENIFNLYIKYKK
jgi:hypothetical protein